MPEKKSGQPQFESQPFFQQLQEAVTEQIDRSKDISDEEVLERIDGLLTDKKILPFMTLSMRRALRTELFNSLRRLGILQELLDDNEVTEIMINGTENIFVEKRGRIYQWHKRFVSKRKLEDVIQQIVGKTNRQVNESSPIVDTRLENGSRVNVVMAPVALNGPVVTIRRFPDKPISMEDLLRFGTLNRECAAFLKKLVMAGYNLFISGGTGSGKTTFLNVLSDYIPKDERVITIEDSAELQLKNLPNLVRLETRLADSEGNHALTMRDLIRSALRMRPDRIVVGEVRGSEAIDMLQAFNTGHDGSLSTGHANSPADMLARLETMILMGMDIPLEAVRRQLASGIDVIIHLGRVRDKSRKVLEIAEITGFEEGEIQLSALYRFQETGGFKGDAPKGEAPKVYGTLQKTGTLKNREKLQSAGISLKEGTNEADPV